jgi:thiol-disulfide isomerase/thioredoxin
MRDRRTAVTRRACLLYGCACAWPAAADAGEIERWPQGARAPQMQASDLGGRLWNLADLRGKAVLLNFWATWCEPCREEMPALQALVPAHGEQRLAVLALNFKEPLTRVTRFVQGTGLGLPVLLDPAGDVARAWGVRIFPSTILIDAGGQPRWRVRGELDWAGAQAQGLLRSVLPGDDNGRLRKVSTS